MEHGILVDQLATDMVPDHIIDGHGGVLLSGLIDSHCHVTTIHDLEDLSSYGVTTAINMGCGIYEVCASLRSQVGLSSFVTVGYPAMAPNSTHARNSNASSSLLIHSADQAAQFVTNVFTNGSDYLKIVSEPNGPDQATQNALVTLTHQHGRLSMTHAADAASFHQAILSQTDIIQHAPVDQNLTSDLISHMHRQHQSLTPTLILPHLVFSFASTNPELLEFFSSLKGGDYVTWSANTRAMHDAGIPVLAGTDANSVLPFPLNHTVYGWSLHEELARLVEDVGLTPAEALRAATVLPALDHVLTNRGVIGNGKRADVVLLTPGADPLVKITDAKRIARVWIGGVEFDDVAQV